MAADAADRRLLNRPTSASRSWLSTTDIMHEAKSLPRNLAAADTVQAPPSPRELVALEEELMALEEEELADLQTIGARVAAREQADWEDQQVLALVRPGSGSRRAASPVSGSDHLSSSAISDLRAELSGKEIHRF